MVSVVDAHTAGALSIVVIAVAFIVAMAVVVRPAMVFGADFRGGVVGDVLDGVASLPINVGIVVNETSDPIEYISAVIDYSPDGWAALDLATRVAQTKNCPLEVIWVPSADDGNSELDEMLSAVSSRVQQIKTIVLEARSPAELVRQKMSNLSVVGANLIDPLKFASQLRQPRRSTIVVQGTSVPLVSAAVREPAAAAGLRST